MVQKLLLGPDGLPIVARLGEEERIEDIAVQHDLNERKILWTATGNPITILPKKVFWEPMNKDQTLWRRK